MPRLAETPAPQPTPDMDPVEIPLPATSVPAEQLAEAARAPSPRPEAAPDVREAPVVEPEEILLAAVLDLGPPRYVYPDPMDGLPFARPRRATLTRSQGPAPLRVRALNPDHVGRTVSAAPTLWFHLDADTDHDLRFQLVDGTSIDPVLQLELEGPTSAGFHSIDLSRFDVVLMPEALYEWSIDVLVDEERPLSNPRTFGAIVRVAKDPIADTTAPSARGHAYAEAGIWYDAFDAAARLAESNPEKPQLLEHRDSMARRAGVGEQDAR